MDHPYHPPLFSKPNNTKMVIIHDIYFKKYFIASYGFLKELFTIREFSHVTINIR